MKDSAAWTPEPSSRIPQLSVHFGSELLLLLRALGATRWGRQNRCNIVLDALIAHEEKP